LRTSSFFPVRSPLAPTLMAANNVPIICNIISLAYQFMRANGREPCKNRKARGPSRKANPLKTATLCNNSINSMNPSNALDKVLPLCRAAVL
jgi:hypothetical protein